MKKEQAIGYINTAITQLCVNCDPDCPKELGRGKLPHCYVNRGKRFELLSVLDNLIFRALTDEEIESFAKVSNIDNLGCR